MNISLTEKLKSYVEERVESGEYGNASEYVRDLIRKQKANDDAIAEIQIHLDEGEASGFVPYNRSEIEERLRLTKSKKRAA
jgi:antitoxin ParD1/3/4